MPFSEITPFARLCHSCFAEIPHWGHWKTFDLESSVSFGTVHRVQFTESDIIRFCIRDKECELLSKTKTHNQHQTHKTPRKKEMIQEKKAEEPVEKVFVKFCARHGVSLDTCRIYYSRLVEKGEIKEK